MFVEPARSFVVGGRVGEEVSHSQSEIIDYVGSCGFGCSFAAKISRAVDPDTQSDQSDSVVVG